MNAPPPLARQRGGIVKKLLIGIAATAVVGVAAVSGLAYLGQQAPDEELLAMAAEEVNARKGEITEGVMRKDGATIDGKTLTIHYTLLEHWREQLSEEAAADMPTAKSWAQAMTSLGAQMMCPDLAKLGDRPITYAMEYRDHEGQLLSSVAVHTSEC